MAMGYNGKDSSPYEPDFDAPWNQRRAETSPKRCEICLYWCGICGLDTRKVTRAEDVCRSFDEHPTHRARREAAGNAWRKIEPALPVFGGQATR